MSGIQWGRSSRPEATLRSRTISQTCEFVFVEGFKKVFVNLSFNPPVPDHKTFNMNTYVPGHSQLKSLSLLLPPPTSGRKGTKPAHAWEEARAGGGAGLEQRAARVSRGHAPQAASPRVGLGAAAPQPRIHRICSVLPPVAPPLHGAFKTPEDSGRSILGPQDWSVHTKNKQNLRRKGG